MIILLWLVPDAPTGLKIIPRYSYKSGHFSGITVEFNSEMVNISPSIMGIWFTQTAHAPNSIYDANYRRIKVYSTQLTL